MKSDRHSILIVRLDERLAATGLSDQAASLKAGRSRDAIRSIRRGVMPNSAGLAALASVLGTTSDYLLGHNDTQPAPAHPAILNRTRMAAAIRAVIGDHKPGDDVAEAAELVLVLYDLAEKLIAEPSDEALSAQARTLSAFRRKA